MKKTLHFHSLYLGALQGLVCLISACDATIHQYPEPVTDTARFQRGCISFAPLMVRL